MVPPVAMMSQPSLFKPSANSTTPVLSLTLISALIFYRFIFPNLCFHLPAQTTDRHTGGQSNGRYLFRPASRPAIAST